MGKGLKERVEVLERRLILTALHKAHGVQAQAAKELGVSERVLRYKMRKYGFKIATKLSQSDRIVESPLSSKKQKVS
ncbi:MAG TPA: helix-turn-helix domain-containing protein [Nitrospiria bacterium]|nr:helix-turn-helix domain-containing protein [Nitrospiria bacterium]